MGRGRARARPFFLARATRKTATTSTVDPNRVILTGENPFIRLSATDGAPYTTDASFSRILFSPRGPGHVLYLKSELTGDDWRIYSDNIAMARWLQSTVQGMLNPGDPRSGDPRDRTAGRPPAHRSR